MWLWLRPLYLVALSLLLVNCGGSHKAVKPISSEVCPESDLDFFKRRVWGPILQYKGCHGCHSENGVAKAAGVRWFLTKEDAEADFATMRAVAVQKAGTGSLLKRKVINDTPVNHAGGNLFPDVGPEGKDVALLQILDEFIARAENPTPPCDSQGLSYDILYGVQEYDYAATLRRARIALTGKIPTPYEETLVAEGGSSGLEAALDHIMQEEDFYERLREIWNDILLTDKYYSDPLIGNYADASSILDPRLYPNRQWFNTFPAQGYPVAITSDPDAMAALRQELRDLTNKAIAREPLELIVHVTKNNLPFYEILTANYFMVNAYSARAYGIQQSGVPVFSDSSYIEDHPYSVFVPAKLTQREVRLSGPWLNNEIVDATKIITVPQAGLLTSPLWLARYPTAEGNANRHRSRMVFEFFLDLNLLTLAQQLEAFGDSDPNPTLNDPNCAVCHTIMDPVAGLFKNYRLGNYYVKDSWYHDNSWLRYTPNTAMRNPGFSVEEPLPAVYDESPLVWLGQKIAADPRFALAVTKHMFKALTGKKPLNRPSENDRPPGTSDAEWQSIYRDLEQAYVIQQRDVAKLQRNFIESNYNLKRLIKDIIFSPYFRAKNARTLEEYRLRHIGMNRLLTPEQLNNKITSITGVTWANQAGIPFLLRDYYFLYGGIDSVNTTVRTEQPNGLMSNIQLRMALEVACRAVVRDFSHTNHSERRLLPLVEPTYAPEVNGISSPTAIEKIKQNIRYLHRQILGEFLPLNHPEIDRTYQLFYLTFKEGWSKRGTANDWDTGSNTNNRATLKCTFNGTDAQGNPLPGRRPITSDPNYVIRAWQATVAYLLTDARFVYE